MIKRISSQTLLLLLLLPFVLATKLSAHGGVDDEPSTSIVSTAPNTLSLVAYPSGFEVFVKYAPPQLNQLSTFSFFFSNWSTNAPVDPSDILLSFPGTTLAQIVQQPRRITSGVYSASVKFSGDSSYTALLEFTVSGEKIAAALSPIYAGKSAQKQLTPAPPAQAPAGNSITTPVVIAIVVLLLIVGSLIAKRYRRRSRPSTLATSQSSTLNNSKVG